MSMQPLPVRTRLTVLRDGATTSSYAVFCEAEERTASLARCATCGHGGAVTNDARGNAVAVACSRFTLPSVPPADESGTTLRVTAAHAGAITNVAARLPVGLALTRAVTIVRYDVPLDVAVHILSTEPSAFGLPVVDEAGRFIGLLSRAAATLALTDPDGSKAGVAGAMALPTCSIDERTSLDVAFVTMTKRRARELTVVNDEREVVGTLHDVDALRFVAYVSRTGLRPPRENAA
jgi:CBS domain-containing protein